MGLFYAKIGMRAHFVSRAYRQGESEGVGQRRMQEFDLGVYKWVKETKQPHKKIKVDVTIRGEGVYRYIYPQISLP